MMKKSIIVSFFISVLIACSNQNNSSTEVLLENFFLPKNDSPQLSEILTDNYQITVLETNEDCLIGRINKIKKFNRHYYILSNEQWIFHFDENGKFIGCLNKRGNGPEEYTEIIDFDVCERDGKTEIWVCDYKNIKMYDAYDLSFLSHISYPFIVHKFVRVDNDKILLLTGQNDYTLTISDSEGAVISEYLKREIPFILFRANQFISYKENFLYQLGIANGYVQYNKEDGEFYRGTFSGDSKFLSEKDILKLFEEHGQDFIFVAYDYTYINGLKNLNNIVWVNIINERKMYLTKIRENELITTQLTPVNTVRNDLFDLEDVTFISTINMCDSDDSLLFYITSDLMDEGEGILDKTGSVISINSEDNPCLIEFY